MELSFPRQAVLEQFVLRVLETQLVRQYQVCGCRELRIKCRCHTSAMQTVRRSVADRRAAAHLALSCLYLLHVLRAKNEHAGVARLCGRTLLAHCAYPRRHQTL